ncbi:replication protein A 32 kDa subunit-like isoform X2 [Gouania willdenowi]|uniref:replication protein A 32 kDa subunit-like isoform X2 n=1 Tax=Gouania willdenowi TaxID=441366 RepID=UPI001054335D|nr:replication protein A 32 kDa subunit-like isoform X2 [Gouania willdenowi]
MARYHASAELDDNTLGSTRSDGAGIHLKVSGIRPLRTAVEYLTQWWSQNRMESKHRRITSRAEDLVHCMGKIMLVAMHIRCVKDLNEITSHMMEVVQAQMYLSGKMVDVNMNTIPASLHDRYSYAHLETSVLDSFSSAQNQVMDVIRRYSINPHGIGSDKLKTNLDDLSMEDIRKALTFLLSEGHVFSTIDENHFKC